MSDLGWRAEGIRRALAVGGIEFERYRQPGFTGRVVVRPVQSAGGEGVEIDAPERDDPEPEAHLRV